MNPNQSNPQDVPIINVSVDSSRMIPSKVGNIKLGRLKQNHPRLDVKRVRTLKALYYGGARLLNDREILREVFPQYTHEKPEVYEERCRRAFYENVFGMVVNQVSAGLAQDPVRYVEEQEDPEEAVPQDEEDLDDDEQDEEDLDEEEEEEEDLDDDELDDEDEEEDEDLDEGPPEAQTAVPKPKVAKKIDPYWEQFCENATALSDDGSTRRTFDQVIRNLGVEGLVTGWAWAQAELPRADSERPVMSYKDQEDAGELRAYVVPWPTECVTDWSEKDGRLLWVRTYQVVIPDEDPAMPRDTKVHQWTFWREDVWYRYELVEKPGQPLPNDEFELAPVDGGKHTFGRVPWTRLDVTGTCGSSLHLGDIIESLCRNYFNRQNGESFQWMQFFFQQLYEFLAPEVAGIDTPISSAQMDPGRAKRTRSPGQVHVRGAGDDAKFVGPDMQGANVGREAMQDLRDAILRIVAQMALAQDTSGAMLRRSGDSKRMDNVAQEIILGAIGKLLVVAANAIAALLATGRGDKEAPPRFVGYEHFNVMDTEALLNQSAIFATLNIPSARAQIEEAYQIAVAKLGDNATPAILKEIREQLEAAITQDQVMQAGAPPEEEEEEEDGLSDDDLDAMELDDDDDEDTEWEEDGEDEEDEGGKGKKRKPAGMSVN